MLGLASYSIGDVLRLMETLESAGSSSPAGKTLAQANAPNPSNELKQTVTLGLKPSQALDGKDSIDYVSTVILHEGYRGH